MTDPRRLLAGGGDSADLGSSELTRWLITSARSEEPGAGALQRTLVGVGATGAVLAATASASAVSASAVSSGTAGAVSSGAVSSGAVSAGTVSVGAVSGGVSSSGVASAASAGSVVAGSALGAAASGGAVGLAGKATGLSLLGAVSKGAALKVVAVTVIGGATLVGAGSQLLAPTKPAAPVTQQAAQQREHTSLSPQIAQPPAQETPKLEQPATVVPSAPAAPGAGAAAPGTSESVEETEATALFREVQLIDRAREAKAAGQNARVIALTQQYLGGFPKGRLLPEALFLKMESESTLGRTAQAAQSAKLLLRVSPGSPHAKRARELANPATNP